MQLVRGYPLAVLGTALALVSGCGAVATHDRPSRVTAVVAELQVAPVLLSARPVVAKPAVRPVVTKPAVRPVVTPSARTTSVAAGKPAAKAARSSSDGYPYRNATTHASDPWGFTERQCVSYAAWRLAQSGRALSNTRDGWGSALMWDDTARHLGITVSSAPQVGSVAQWNAGESSTAYAPGSGARGRFTAGGYGHVGYVTAVYADGSVQVAQYNVTGDRGYSSMHLRAPRYLLV